MVSAVSVLLGIASVTCNAGLVVGGLADLDTSESVYSEVLGSGILRFDSAYSDFENNMFIGSTGNVTELRDINNDGIPDMIWGYQGLDRSIQYALGYSKKDASIGFRRYVPRFEINYDGMTVADLAGDGWPDLISAEENDSWLKITWIDNGKEQDVTFEGNDDLGYDIETIQYYLDFRLTIRGGDLDGDQRPDLVLNTSRQKVVVRLSSRDQGDELESYDAPMLGDQNALYQLEDYDGDGELDILLLDADSESFVILRGTGTDTLEPAETIALPMSGYVQSLAYPSFGQFDNDPAMDLVLYDAVTDQTIIFANFAGDVSTVHPLMLEPGARVQCVPGDIDFSGSDDLLLTGLDPLSNGPDTIDEKWLMFDPLDPHSNTIKVETGNAGDSYNSIAWNGPRNLVCKALELNGDGKLDLLWMSSGAFYSTIYNDENLNQSGTGLMVSPQQVSSNGSIRFGADQYAAHPEAFHMLAHDIDSDGQEELFIVGDGSAKSFVLEDGAASIEDVAGLDNAFMTVDADLDGDGSAELIASRVGLGMAIQSVDSAGNFGINTPVLNPNGNAYLGVDSGDFDQDGKDDVVAIDWTADEIHVYTGISDSEVSLASVIVFEDQIRSVKPGLIDLNGDGYKDLVVGVTDGLRVFENMKNGSFQYTRDIELQSNPFWIVPADMDHDGVVDLVMAMVGGSSFDLIAVAYFDSNGVVDETVNLQRRNSTVINEVVVGDFNNDGLPDLVGSTRRGPGSQISGSNKHCVWVQEDTRRFKIHAVLPAADSYTIGASDMNLDGYIDVITASDLDDSVRVHWGQGAGCAVDLNGDGSLDFFDLSAFLSERVDFNGDGSFDFFDISAFLTAFASGCP